MGCVFGCGVNYGVWVVVYLGFWGVYMVGVLVWLSVWVRFKGVDAGL